MDIQEDAQPTVLKFQSVRLRSLAVSPVFYDWQSYRYNSNNKAILKKIFWNIIQNIHFSVFSCVFSIYAFFFEWLTRSFCERWATWKRQKAVDTCKMTFDSKHLSNSLGLFATKKWGIRSEFLKATLSQKFTFEQKYMASYMAIGAVHAHQVVVAWWIWQWNGSFFNSCYWVRVSVTKSEYGINFPSFRLKAWLLRAHVS